MLKPRKKKCRACREWFQPFSSLSVSCSNIQCAIEVGKQSDAKKKRKENRIERERIKPRAKYMSEAQAEFNRFIRLRDGNWCISCNQLRNGQIQAGHFRPKTWSAIRFSEANVNSQCVSCNMHNSGKLTEYEKYLRVKIGDEEVERLKNSTELRQWTIEELKLLKTIYKEKAKVLTSLM